MPDTSSAAAPSAMKMIASAVSRIPDQFCPTVSRREPRWPAPRRTMEMRHPSMELDHRPGGGSVLWLGRFERAALIPG